MRALSFGRKPRTQRVFLALGPFSYAFESDFAQAGREINRKTKGKHAAEMAAYEARIGAFKFELYPGQDKRKEKANNQ
jgi:hypothetical protein